ncbi:MAG: DUF2061 domain-containing protein [Bacteroidales bacterium]
MEETKERKNSLEAAKDSPGRSVLKAISWRIMASTITFFVVFVIFRRYSDQSFAEMIQTASFITAIEFVAKLIAYYLHERMWTNIRWGKKWMPWDFKKRAWRKMYRDMHKASGV